MITLFQKDEFRHQRTSIIAWKVIKQCSYGNYHPLTYVDELELCASDGYGNYSPRLPVETGSRFAVSPRPIGRRLARQGRSDRCDAVSVENCLPRGAVAFNLFRSGRLLWRTPPLAPGQSASFRFSRTLFVAALQSAREGAPIPAAAPIEAATALFLGAVRSADIVMTGGGEGLHAEAIRFTLESVNRLR